MSKQSEAFQQQQFEQVIQRWAEQDGVNGAARQARIQKHPNFKKLSANPDYKKLEIEFEACKTWEQQAPLVFRFCKLAAEFGIPLSDPDTPTKLLADLNVYKVALRTGSYDLSKIVHGCYQRAHELGNFADIPVEPDGSALAKEQAERAIDELRKWCVRQQRPANANGNTGGEPGRRGRLPKQDSEALRASISATLSQHPSMVDDPKQVAEICHTSEATARREIEKRRREYLESRAANADPDEVREKE